MKVLLEYNRRDLRNGAGEDLATQFFDNRQKYPAPYNNLDYWISKSTPEELRTYMDNYKSKNQKDREERLEGAEKIYDDGRGLVVLCKTYKAMTQYGKGTRGCIAGNYPGHETRGEEYFKSYKEQRYTDYYVYIDRKGELGNDKGCVCPLQEDPTTKRDIGNAPDNTVQYIENAPNIKGLPPVSNIIIDNDTLVKVINIHGMFVVPGNVRHIGRKALFKTYLTKIYFTNSIESIGSGAFADSDLEDLNIPEGVSSVGNAICLSCNNLSKITLPSTLTVLTKNMLAYCNSLHEVRVNGKINNIDDSGLDGSEQATVYTNASNTLLVEGCNRHNIKCVVE